MCGGREEKRKAGEYMSGGKKEQDIKKKKEIGIGFTCMLGKKRVVEKKEEKKILKGKKLNWFYLYVHFV